MTSPSREKSHIPASVGYQFHRPPMCISRRLVCAPLHNRGSCIQRKVSFPFHGWGRLYPYYFEPHPVVSWWEMLSKNLNSLVIASLDNSLQSHRIKTLKFVVVGWLASFETGAVSDFLVVSVNEYPLPGSTTITRYCRIK